MSYSTFLISSFSDILCYIIEKRNCTYAIFVGSNFLVKTNIQKKIPINLNPFQVNLFNMVNLGNRRRALLISDDRECSGRTAITTNTSVKLTSLTVMNISELWLTYNLAIEIVRNILMYWKRISIECPYENTSILLFIWTFMQNLSPKLVSILCI